MPRHSRPMPRHNAQEGSDRAALPSPPDLSPTGADGVFVPNNGVITLNLNQLPTKKKTEGLQYQQVPSEPRKSRVSGLKKAVFRVSCLVFRENLGIRAGLRLAPGNGRVSGLGSRKYLKSRGLGGFVVSSRRVLDGRGLGFRSQQRRHHSQPRAHSGRKNKTEGLQYQQVPNEPRKGRVSGLKKAVFRKKAVIRVSCLVIRENHGQGGWFAPEEMFEGR